MSNSRVVGKRAHRGRRNRARTALLLALFVWGVFAVWRGFPRFDSRLVGRWEIRDLGRTASVITFHEGGFGQRGNEHGHREFRWWTCGNRLLMHPNHVSRSANYQAVAEYALRAACFLGPPAEVSEFKIVRIEADEARFDRRTWSGGIVTETLVLHR
ncbi:hypothetical protein Pan44_21080 [Caulifigura coniformis]|uniref:Uncharacterized protein n=1 Tax=Caulifigura coniformis TaxID=2527983 RepID=A0A517SD89_9PLAN|nr:hypothetical protein [Caulifigura coniformis]QDT54081.1 hypothetical protein Pan44_21080 [Caulifigura coniformis]